MIELVDANDSRTARNKDNVLSLYELMINKKKPEEAVAKFVSPMYVQHNPIVPDGAGGLASFFGEVGKQHDQARVVVHAIIAVGDYVWAHVNFLNMFNDDPQDNGVAGVDIYRMDTDGKAIEHWDVLQVVGNRENAAQWYAPNVARAHTNGMF
ncbi:MAG: nuclear transport factor 2 family protein [Pyrinomonadaceae bacterium]|nr:nuclear transport factor 2 family protein [Pyrinomonadaceae bacterium]